MTVLFVAQELVVLAITVQAGVGLTTEERDISASLTPSNFGSSGFGGATVTIEVSAQCDMIPTYSFWVCWWVFSF